jgi:hypothetical protein
LPNRKVPSSKVSLGNSPICGTYFGRIFCKFGQKQTLQLWETVQYFEPTQDLSFRDVLYLPSRPKLIQFAEVRTKPRVPTKQSDADGDQTCLTHLIRNAKKAFWKQRPKEIAWFGSHALSELKKAVSYGRCAPTTG